MPKDGYAIALWSADTGLPALGSFDSESGIRCGRVRYRAAQPWPFPSSLMIGFLAEALTEEITVDPEELAEARWFSRDEVREMVARAADGPDDPQQLRGGPAEHRPALRVVKPGALRMWSTDLSCAFGSASENGGSVKTAFVPPTLDREGSDSSPFLWHTSVAWLPSRAYNILTTGGSPYESGSRQMTWCC